MKESDNKPKIGLWPTTSLVVGNMIGSGIFLLPAALAQYGAISIGGWVISSIGAFLLARMFAGLSKKFPKVGGPYAYTRAGLGDFPAFLVAWGYWLSILATNAAITVAMLSYLTVFFPVLSSSPGLMVGIGLSIIWLLTWVNNQGIRHAGWVQLSTTILKVIPLILIAFVGIFWVELDHFSPINLSSETDGSALVATITLTLFAFLGIESATIPADGIKHPAKTIPRATMLGTLATIGIYIIGSVAVMGLIPPELLQKSQAPFADAAGILWGDWAKKWVAIGAIISTFGALNGWILMQGQVPFAAAKDNLFPRIFSVLNTQNSPSKGIIISSIIISVLLLMNFTKGFIKAFEFMILLSTLAVLVPYLFSAIVQIIFSHRANKPLGIGLGVGAFIFSVWAVIGSGLEVIQWGSLLLLLGLPLYFWLKRVNYSDK